MDPNALLLIAAVIVFGLTAAMHFQGKILERTRRRLAALEALLRAEQGELRVCKEQLRLARAELGIPKPFGEIQDRRPA